MDENFGKVMERFITERLTWHGRNESDATNDAYMELRSRVERLRETLAGEQALLLRDCENAYCLADGETRWFCYEAGFRDAIQFLLHFGTES